jgi:selenide,water dikinase
VLASVANFEDAGVYKISDDVAIVQSVDVITPVVDDPFVYGQICAANAMSDIYAMGAKPITALNVAGIPICDFDNKLLVEIQKGGLDKLNEAGCSLLGGHTLDDVELKYGLCITGTAHPDKIYYINKARAGDEIILTKPIGNGIITTAYKANLADGSTVEESIKNMITLNDKASGIMTKYDVSACTDVTGFGLLGHMYEAAHSSKITARIFYEEIPVISGAYEYASMGLVPSGSHSNEQFLSGHIAFEKAISKTELSILCDPQTSGGLLIFVNKNNSKNLLKDLKDNGIIHAHIIGTVLEKSEKPIIIS